MPTAPGSTSGNWSATPPNSTDSVALLGNVITAPHTVTVGANTTLGNLTLSSSNAYTVAGPGTISMQVSSGDASLTVTKGSHLISAPVVLASNTDVTVMNAADSLAFGGSLSMTGSGSVLTKYGAGTMTINSGATVNLSAFNITKGTVTLNATARGSIGTATINLGTLNYNAAVINTLNLQSGQLNSGPGATVATATLSGGCNTQNNNLLVTNTLFLLNQVGDIHRASPAALRSASAAATWSTLPALLRSISWGPW